MIPCLDPKNDPELWFTGSPKAEAEAKALCSDCPQRSECLSLAIQAEEGTPLSLRFGIFGGMTPKERSAASVPF